MGLGRGTKWICAAAVVVAGVAVLVRPGAIYSLVTEVYPSDPGKREALELCFLQDQRFNRLDAGERANCYSRAMLAGLAPSSDPPKANPIDLRRDAAVGNMPRDDVRRIEEMGTALHLPH